MRPCLKNKKFEKKEKRKKRKEKQASQHCDAGPFRNLVLLDDLRGTSPGKHLTHVTGFD